MNPAKAGRPPWAPFGRPASLDARLDALLQQGSRLKPDVRMSTL